MNWSDAAAVATAYAAIVSTAALALEIRRWFETGPRLRLNLMPRAGVYGDDIPDEATYLAANVTNLGSSPTTVTHFALHRYPTIIHRWRGRPTKSAIVANPAHGQPLPYLLQPGTQWMGSVKYNDDLTEWAEAGNLYVAIYHSCGSKPVLQRVKLPPEKKPSSNS